MRTPRRPDRRSRAAAPEAAWLADPDGSGRLRWWDGARWTDAVAEPARPVDLSAGSTVAPTVADRRRRWPVWSWVVIGAVALVVGLLLAPLTAVAAVVVVITGVVALTGGGRTWLRFRSRGAAGVVTAAAAVVFVATAGISTAAYANRHPSSPVVAQPAAVTATPTPSETPTPTPTPSVDDAAVVSFSGRASTAANTSATTGTALSVLATLPVKGRAPTTGYSRDQFGQQWLDVDRNGCDTRNDTLARDLTDVVRSGPCRVLSGTLLDPYTGGTIGFVRGQGTSELVQIDHVVSLSDAWQTGAQQLTADQRASFANDPLDLLAVDQASNAQKGDGDAATWLPSAKPFRCAYIARQVSVKATYGLWVTQAEHDAMARILADCPDEPALSSSFAAVAPTPTPTPTPTPAPVAADPEPAPADPAPAPEPAPAPAAPSSVYYPNCTAARAAGAAPIHIGEPGYSTKLDRDGDGIACE